MSGFHESYVGRLRAIVGDRKLLVPGVRIVVERPDGALLLQRRSDFNLWGIPAGAPEEGEHIAEVAARELEEETGLRIAKSCPFGYASDPDFETISFPNGDTCQYFSLLVYTREYEGSLEIRDDESLELDWFKPDQLPEMLPNMRRSVEAYGRFRMTGNFQMI